MPRLRHRGETKLTGDLPGGIDRANYHIVGVKTPRTDSACPKP
jgi:hypothetical protein